MMRRGLTLLAAALLVATAARSSPLGKDGCAQLKLEQAELEHAGTRASMSKGPQWAKNNLEPAKLEQIRRLLEIDEQLLFRCGGKPLVSLPKDPDPDPAAREPGDNAAKAPAVAKVPRKELPKKAAAAPSPDQPAKAAPKKKAAATKSQVPPAAADKGAAAAEKKDAQKTAAARKAKAKPKEPASSAAPLGAQQ
jgi:outer membrane biosynthesis protein TonB